MQPCSRTGGRVNAECGIHCPPPQLSYHGPGGRPLYSTEVGGGEGFLAVDAVVVEDPVVTEGAVVIVVDRLDPSVVVVVPVSETTVPSSLPAVVVVLDEVAEADGVLPWT